MESKRVFQDSFSLRNWIKIPSLLFGLICVRLNESDLWMDLVMTLKLLHYHYRTITISGFLNSEVVPSPLEVTGSRARMFSLWGDETTYLI